MWFAGSQLSYRELDQRANQLAHHLQTLGVGPDTVVGVCVERGLDMVIALLGVLKAGGAYVPLDPEYPVDRLAFMLTDTAAPVVITQQTLTTRLPHNGPALVRLDTDRALIEAQPGTTPEQTARPNNIAYVIYTSGSTGTPKGVLVEHRNVVNFLFAADLEFPPAEAHGSALHSSIAFDLPLPSIFLPLVQGQDIVILPSSGKEGVEQLAQALADGQSFSTLKMTPSHLEMVLELVRAGGGKIDVNTLVVAGEPFTRAGSNGRGGAPRRPRSSTSYGPTETAVVHAVPRIVDGTRRVTAFCRSGGRSPTPSCTCWTRPARRCRWACPASCTSAARAWPAATWTGRS